MNILLISYYFGEYASGIISERIANALTEYGQHVSVVTFSQKPKISNPLLRVLSIRPSYNETKLLYKIFRKFLYILGVNRYIWHKEWQIPAREFVRRLINRENFDWIYCRSTPFDANMVVVGLKTNIPILQHFTDPLPPVGEYMPKGASVQKLLKNAKKILDASSLVSFGNEFMQSYQNSLLDSRIENSFVSYDVVASSNIRYLKKRENRALILVFMGNIYGARNPRPLIDAIRSMLNKNNVKLEIYSPRPRIGYIEEPFVEYKGYTKDVFSAMGNADILLDLDGDVDRQVYISSKLKDYILVNRPILAITQDGSPSCNLLSGMKTALVVNNDSSSIASGINELCNRPLLDSDYSERATIIHKFSPSVVANEIITHLQSFQTNICNK